MQDVKWLQTITSLPILVKGVVTAEDSKCSVSDFQTFEMQLHTSTFTSAIVMACNHTQHVCNAARLAIEYGAAGIIVSNHGARQLDYVPATISCLEEVPYHFPLFRASEIYCVWEMYREI